MSPTFLRAYINDVLSAFLLEGQDKYFIRWSPKKKQFLLYKKFRGPDRFGRINDQLVVAAELGPALSQAEAKAQEVTGQELRAKDPNQIKQHPGDIILPYAHLKGMKVKDVKLDDLIWMIIRTKWMNRVKEDKYRQAVYDYLTTDRLKDTVTYFKNMFKGLPLSKLIEWYSSLQKAAIYLVFSDITFPIIKDELKRRKINTDEKGNIISNSIQKQ
jgi:hypothetical protein